MKLLIGNFPLNDKGVSFYHNSLYLAILILLPEFWLNFNTVIMKAGM
jgi:hypothetical protein